MRQPSPSRRRRTLALLTVFVLVLTACTSGSGESADPPATGGNGSVGTGAASGLPMLRLSAGQPVEDDADPIAVVAGTPLEAARVDAIVRRLPPFLFIDPDLDTLSRPATTLQPPLVGETIDQPFGAAGDDEPPEVESGPLEVVRFQPAGDVDVAPFLSVTFNQPMVPLTTLDQLDEIDVPIEITPDLDGVWRWVGTRTARFDHTSEDIDRLPMATEYTVSIPADTTSETGGVLADDVTFSFRTATPTVTSVTPDDERVGLPLTPVFTITFDQIVEPAAIRRASTLLANGEQVDLRVATTNEVIADDDARAIHDRSLPGRVVSLTPNEPLPTNAALELRIGPNVPSAEGPRTNDDVEIVRARTYGAFQVVRTDCGGGRCEPGSWFEIELSNELDRSAFDPSFVTVEPAIPGLQVNAFGNFISIAGATSGNTDYEVTLSTAITDSFGQAIGGDRSHDFAVGPARPRLSGFPQRVLIADPVADDPAVSVSVVNHTELRLRVYRPRSLDDLDSLDRLQDQIYDGGVRIPQSFTEVADQVILTDAEEHEPSEVPIPVGRYLDGDHGHLLVLVEPTTQYDRDSDDFWNNLPVFAWVQVTDIGLDAVADNDEVLVWTTDLATGEPISVDVQGFGDTVTTSTDGVGTLTLPSNDGRRRIVARDGDDSVVLDGWWSGYTLDTESRWYVIDDRRLYRPGETVSVTGFARERTPGPGLNLSRYPAASPVTWQVLDSRGVELAGGTTSLDAAGAFDLTFDLPAGANLGSATLGLAIEGQNAAHHHAFQIQEFRRPEFEVTARTEGSDPHFAVDPTTVSATAEYFAGGPLPHAPVVWSVTTRDGTYAPPGWTDYSFGAYTPWWFAGPRGFGADVGFGFEGGDVFFDDVCCFEDSREVNRYEGVTDGSGTNYLQIDFEGDAPDLPVVVSANASVEDVNRQAFADTTDVLIHAGAYYVGLRTPRTFVRRGESLDVDLVVTDIDGAAVVDREVEVVADRVVYGYENGSYGETVADSQTCTVTSAAEAVTCTFGTGDGGEYRITATVTDDDRGRNRTELTRWVSGGVVPDRNVTLESATLVPSERDLEPGDTLEVLIQAPFGPGSALVTVFNEGLQSDQLVTVDDDGAGVVEIPLTDEHVPGINVQVEVVGAALRIGADGRPDSSAPRRPAFATASLAIDVPPVNSRLTVEATPDDRVLAPGASTTVDVAVTDRDGAPVSGASVSVIVVDEAVLALAGYDPGDPFDSFLGRFGTFVDVRRSRESLVLTANELLASPDEAEGVRLDSGAAGGATDDAGDFAAEDGADAEFAAPTTTAPSAASLDRDASTGGNAAIDTPIDVRTNFDALAVFAPGLSTNARGRVSVDVDLPHNHTRYRIIAIAGQGDDRFGLGESSLTARLPVQARPSPPRFLNFGDSFEFPVVVQNQTDEEREIEVVLETGNLLAPTAPRGVLVSVPANDRVEVRFPTEAALAGTARYRVTVVTGDRADSAQGEIPVYTPTTTEAFATYGVIDAGTIGQTVLTPTDVVTAYGGLEVSTSSTALQSLTDAVLYLEEYSYRSVDAHASRVLAIVALRDVLDAFDAEGMPDPAAADDRVRADIDRIEQLQNSDGGFGWWSRQQQSSPYQSLHATHALVVASTNGFDVDEQVLENALFYLTEIRQFIPSTWSTRTRDTLTAYALHVRDLAGRGDAGAARDLYRNGDLALDGIAWLWTAVDNGSIEAEIERTFTNRVVETPSAATFASDYGEEAHLILGSDRRTDGIVLGALIEMRPDSDLIPKVVTGLIGNQVQGRWNNAQENAFILLAMKAYYDTFEAEDPFFVARVWLGDLYANESAFLARSTVTNRSVIPMEDIIDQDDPLLVIAKDGAGRLYYRLGLQYAPDDLRLDPRDQGFVVSRTYESVDGSDDVRRRADGTWEIAAGAEVRVTVTMVAESRRTNVALVDPLPAGLEPVNPALAASPDLPVLDDGGDSFSSYWYWRWYEFQNLRDDRVEAITSYLWAGTYEYSYVARATTPGRFVVPPAYAEEIYSPEVFGRASTEIVEVVDPNTATGE